MPLFVRDIIEALVDTLIDVNDIPASSENRKQTYEYVRATIDAMPDYLRAGILLLTIFFGISTVLDYRKSFSRLNAMQRLKHVHRWRGSTLNFKRSMMSFFETFTTFGIYSQIYPEDSPISRVRIT